MKGSICILFEKVCLSWKLFTIINRGGRWGGGGGGVGGAFSDFVSFLEKSIFLFNKKHRLTLWFQNLISPFKIKIKIIEKPHIVLLPGLWFLSCNNNFENPMISAWVGAPQKLTWKLTLRTETIFGDWKPFESDEKCFLFQLKSSFRSQDI